MNPYAAREVPNVIPPQRQNENDNAADENEEARAENGGDNAAAEARNNDAGGQNRQIVPLDPPAPFTWDYLKNV